MLQSLQAARKAAHEAAMKEAVALLQFSEMRGLEYFPTHGWVPFFRPAEIHAAIDRRQRLHLAATADFTRFKPRKFHAQAA